MHLIRQIETALARIETFLIVLLLSLMILFSFGQVILRNFFNDSHEQLIAALLDDSDSDLSHDELENLAKMIEQARKELQRPE